MAFDGRERNDGNWPIDVWQNTVKDFRKRFGQCAVGIVFIITNEYVEQVAMTICDKNGRQEFAFWTLSGRIW